MDQPHVVVHATGAVGAVPDAVAVQLTVEVVADTPGEALSGAATLVAEVLAVLDAAGVAPADRRTTGLSANPHWDGQVQGMQGHQAQYGLRVLAADAGAAGGLVQAVAGVAGTALRVESFRLVVRDPAPHRALARAAAVRACREQAGQLAEAAGVRLGALLRLVEDGRGGGYAVLESSSPVVATGPAVEAGVEEVTVGVTATYALAD